MANCGAKMTVSVRRPQSRLAVKLAGRAWPRPPVGLHRAGLTGASGVYTALRYISEIVMMFLNHRIL